MRSKKIQLKSEVLDEGFIRGLNKAKEIISNLLMENRSLRSADKILSTLITERRRGELPSFRTVPTSTVANKPIMKAVEEYGIKIKKVYSLKGSLDPKPNKVPTTVFGKNNLDNIVSKEEEKLLTNENPIKKRNKSFDYGKRLDRNVAVCQIESTPAGARFFHDLLKGAKNDMRKRSERNKKTDFSYSVSLHEPNDYEKQLILVSDDLTAGAIVINTNKAEDQRARDMATDPELATNKKYRDKEMATKDIVSVFGNKSSSTFNVLGCAVELGGETLDAYTVNEKLPELYSMFGFKEYGRLSYFDEYAPDDMPETIRTHSKNASDSIAKGGIENTRKVADVALMGRKERRDKSAIKQLGKNAKKYKPYNAFNVDNTSLEDYDDDFDEVANRRNEDIINFRNNFKRR